MGVSEVAFAIVRGDKYRGFGRLIENLLGYCGEVGGSGVTLFFDYLKLRTVGRLLS
jgi:hypothetical protein